MQTILATILMLSITSPAASEPKKPVYLKAGVLKKVTKKTKPTSPAKPLIKPETTTVWRSDTETVTVQGRSDGSIEVSVQKK